MRKRLISPHLLPAATQRARGILPGLLLCLAVTAAAAQAQALEIHVFGRAWLESLVLAIVLGAGIRTLWAPAPRWQPGIDFSAKFLLEVAIVLLGASIDARMISAAGMSLVVGIVAVVFAAIAASYGLGRLFGLPRRMAALIACGNSICGNSAIAAVAPVIGAHPDDVSASIAFTAVLGVAVVLALPPLDALTHMAPHAFGVFAGLTVYAVPQVLAATLPVSAAAAQLGTLVKLIRVLTLGPVVFAASLVLARAEARSEVAATGARRARPGIGRLFPWFIAGFGLMLAARSLGWIPRPIIAPMANASTWLTVVSMAALGLGVDARDIASAGPRVTLVVTLSLLVLGGIAWGLLTLLHLT